jgi:uncharacterized protein
VTATAICPGPVSTELQETSNPLFGDRLPKLVWRKPERVAADAVERGRRSIVPGGLPVRAAFAPNRLAPARVALPVARRLMSAELERRG